MVSVLPDHEIISACRGGRLKIDPFDEELVAPASYDLRLGHRILAAPLSPTRLGEVVDLSEDRPTYDIQSGQMVGVLSLERIEMPSDMSGRFGIRSSFARRGIDAFGGLQLDPGFRGVLIMNLLNVGPESVTITYGQPLFSVEFNRLETPALRPYSGPYQDQDDFPADQYNFILSARTSSLAEIPALRAEVSKLAGLIEELEELLPDPDEGYRLRPDIKERLARPKENRSLVSLEEMRKRLGLG